MYGVLLISLVNNDFQINKCTIILHTVQRICYALSILNITYIPYRPYAIIKALSFKTFPETIKYLLLLALFGVVSYLCFRNLFRITIKISN